jgi:hypothetical protein
MLANQRHGSRGIFTLCQSIYVFIYEIKRRAAIQFDIVGANRIPDEFLELLSRHLPSHNVFNRIRFWLFSKDLVQKFFQHGFFLKALTRPMNSFLRLTETAQNRGDSTLSSDR